MPSMIAQALRDPEYWKSVRQGLTDTANRGFVGSLLGAPVDIANMAMGSLGVPVSQKPVMGSEWIGQKMQDVGVVSPNRNPVAETLASFVDPATVGTGAAKLGTLGTSALLGMTKSAGKAQDALNVVDGGVAMSVPEFKNLSSKQSLLKASDRSYGSALPEHPRLNIMPNTSIAMVKGNPNLTVKSLPDGSYEIKHNALWGSGQKDFYATGDDLDSLITGAESRLNKSDKAISAAQKSRYEKSLAGQLEKEFGDIFDYAKSQRSESQYITHKPSGTKIRISGHKLPLGYEGADLDVPIGLSIDEKLQMIKDYLK